MSQRERISNALFKGTQRFSGLLKRISLYNIISIVDKFDRRHSVQKHIVYNILVYVHV